MGLDIYLYHCPNRKEARQVEIDFDEQSEEIWRQTGDGSYDDLTQEQKDDTRQKVEELKNQLGLVKYGQHPDVTGVNVDSSLYPDHLFKVGYFRSSYNSTGIERIGREAKLPTLHDIFNCDDEYEFVPNWESVKQNTISAIKKWKEYSQTNEAKYGFMEVSHNPFSAADSFPQSVEDVRQLFFKHINEESKWSKNYSSKEGEFRLDGIKMFAAIPAIYHGFIGKQPAIYLVHESFTDWDWYIQALEIVKETAEYVLSHDDPQNYYLHWSG